MTNETIQELEGTVKRADQLAVGDLVVEVPEYGKAPRPMRVALAHPFKDGNRRPMVALVLDDFSGMEPMYVRARAEAKYDTAGAEQEWLFTFGAGQVFDGRFVRIFGTYESARSRMNRVFGHAWRDQYDWRGFDAAGLPARVTELPRNEWPPHIETTEDIRTDAAHADVVNAQAACNVAGCDHKSGTCEVVRCATCGEPYDGTEAPAAHIARAHIAHIARARKQGGE